MKHDKERMAGLIGIQATYKDGEEYFQDGTIDKIHRVFGLSRNYPPLKWLS